MSFFRCLHASDWVCTPAVFGCLSVIKSHSLVTPVVSQCAVAARETGARRGSTLAQGSKPRHAQLQWVDPESRKEVAQILEQAERAAQRWEISYTHFVSPPVATNALTAINQMADVAAVLWGGYRQAERCRIAMGREDVMLAATEDPSQLTEAVAALNCRGNFMFDPASHKDFLGAILGTGVVRERVGDILLQGEGGAQILVDPELVEHFEATLTKVRTVPVETRAIPVSQLRVAPPRREEISSIEASLRLDAVASAGFRMSRGRMAELVKAGDVRVNWRPASKGSTEVNEGDVVSCAGKGRLEIVSISKTKKDKFAVSMVRSV
eukprot:GHRR01010547.1.p1 GENE.GHRR01010547.1~~GHRR01010547.1.p1  ORF type:complete len:324 (+),score=44.55 GHRR01010547.1:145-1116(+)